MPSTSGSVRGATAALRDSETAADAPGGAYDGSRPETALICEHLLGASLHWSQWSYLGRLPEGTDRPAGGHRA